VRARDLAEHFPVVALTDDAHVAAQQMAAEHRPGLIVLDRDGRPYAVLPGSQVLRFLLPAYVQDDPALARAYNESAADELMGRLAHVEVAALLPRPSDRADLPVVDGDATALEIAALMAGAHSPLVAVVDDGVLLGAVTVSRLLRGLLGGQG
jgi:CBS domain-containing protein